MINVKRNKLLAPHICTVLIASEDTLIAGEDACNGANIAGKDACNGKKIQMKILTTTVLLTFLNLSVMSKEIKTSIVINATPAKVWAILTNFNNYPTWNPFIKSITGQAKVGSKIKARIEPPNASGMTFKPTVLAFDTNKEFRWLGHFLMPGLFDGEHKFELIDNGNGTTTFIQSENFKGILLPLFKKMLDVNTLDGFNQMNQKLKELAEKE